MKTGAVLVIGEISDEVVGMVIRKLRHTISLNSIFHFKDLIDNKETRTKFYLYDICVVVATNQYAIFRAFVTSVWNKKIKYYYYSISEIDTHVERWTIFDSLPDLQSFINTDTQ